MSALNFNKVMQCGRLTADVELRATQGGRSVVSFSLAVNRPRPKDGTEQKADFFQCVAWEKTAEFISRYFHKGDALFIVGKLQTRSYKAKEGHTVYVTEIVIDEAHFVDSKSDAAAQPSVAAPRFETIDPDEDFPF
jgi:single-strand DNA-binding protein